jgi:hypothetical protein
MAKKSKRRTPARKKAAPARQRATGRPHRPQQTGKTYTSKPVLVDFAGQGHRFVRADLEIAGIFHSEASYEGRIFLNNPSANAETPRTLERGYAGSFNIFGHGGCFGDVGHCDIKDHREPYDMRVPHPLTPANKRITITTTLRAIAKSTNQVTITVVPVVQVANNLCDVVDVFRFESMRILTYNP